MPVILIGVFFILVLISLTVFRSSERQSAVILHDESDQRVIDIELNEQKLEYRRRVTSPTIERR